MHASRRISRCLITMLAIGLGACGPGGQQSVPAPSPTTAPSTVPSAEPSGPPSPTDSAETAPQLPVQPCCSELALEPGRFALPGWLGPLVELDIDDGWSTINDAAARYLVFGMGENSVGTPTHLVTFLGTPNGSVVADVVAIIRSTGTLSFDGEPEAIDVGPYQASVIDATAQPSADRTDDPGSDIAAGTVDLDPLEAFVEAGFGLTTSTPEAHLRFLVIEVDGRALVVMLEAPAADAETFFGRAEAMLGTLERQ